MFQSGKPLVFLSFSYSNRKFVKTLIQSFKRAGIQCSTGEVLYERYTALSMAWRIQMSDAVIYVDSADARASSDV
jgi:hypothetical protein